MMMRAVALFVVFGIASQFSCLAAQQPQNVAATQKSGENSSEQDDSAPIPAVAPVVAGHMSSPDDVIGSDDSITIACLESEEISKTWRVTSTGDVSLPLVGRIHA